jgi:hypothetical protein
MGLPQPQKAVVTRYCAGCHNDSLKTGGLTLTSILGQSTGEHSDVWEMAVRKLRAHHMPPPGLPQPDQAVADGLISYLESALDRAALSKPNPGRTDTFRRLNRTEYRNVIRDLLDLDVDVSSLLPADDVSHGFDNITVGELSPTLLERYLTAAQRISRLAVGSPMRSPDGSSIMLPPDLTQEDHFDKLPFGTRGGTVVRYTFPLDAEYEIQLRLSRDRNEQIEGLYETHQLDLTIDGERIQQFMVKPPPRRTDHESFDKDFRVRVPVKAGPHFLAASFTKKSSALLETERQPYAAHFNMDRHPRIQPAIYSISVTGPFGTSAPGDTPSRRRIFVCRPANASQETDCAKRIVSTLMRRAYRRPVVESDLRVPLKFYEEARSSDGFDAGIEMALRAMLVNPRFLFRIEKDPAGVAPQTAYHLSDIELASRLSFFLWSSIPDDELLDAAIRGKLRQPAVLERQARRMLADPRSESLVSNFAGQWLYLRNLESMTPDARLFPDFDDNLRQSMRRETELFVNSIVREDRSVLDLLRAKYSFLNERLAKHYGVPNVYGSRFRRVEFPADSARGGLLTQASILTVTSYPNRTSPVLRGKWILGNVLGAPPPPPPPNVPELKETNSAGKVLTVRDRLAQHRDNPACSSCHRLMDPVGFALENYDAVGRWRSHEGDAPVDAAGNLPGGQTFEGTTALQRALLEKPELFAAAFSEKLLTYALGRGVEPYDAPAVRQIVSGARRDDFRFSAVVLGIVKSVPFQMRRSQ